MKFTFKDIEEGTYHARVTEVKQDKGPFGPFLRLTFTIDTGELKNYKFSGFVKPTHLKQSKFYRWVTHILGEQPPDDFDTKDLLDRHCRILLSKVKDFYSVTDVYRENQGFMGINIDRDSISGIQNRSDS
jgi:hypothetical protein